MECDLVRLGLAAIMNYLATYEYKLKSGKMEAHTNMPNVNETGEQPKHRAVTAESMAAKQRDISVSEFLAKNRLSFANNPSAMIRRSCRNALIAMVKSADFCDCNDLAIGHDLALDRALFA